MKRALELARLGFGSVHPNPMVGAVLVCNGEIVGEGYHRKYGAPHAEVEAIRSVRDTHMLKDTTLYVTLEPCNHTGKTPPCSEAVIESGIKRVVIGSFDPNAVAGGGAVKLRENGISVETGVLEPECRDLNKRFFTFFEKKRPYIILKWAETADGFIARSDFTSQWISCEESRIVSRKWRSQEMAILIGSVTAIHDNPHLTARIAGGKNPVRVIIDRELKIPTSFHIFDESAETLLFNEKEDYQYPAATLIKIDFSTEILPQIMKNLFERGLQSVIVEGGTKTLQAFIQSGLWDEARIFSSKQTFGSGIKAPVLDRSRHKTNTTYIEEDTVSWIFRN